MFAVWAVLNVIGWVGLQDQLPTALLRQERESMLKFSGIIAVLFFSLHILAYLGSFNSNQQHLTELLQRGIFDNGTFKIKELYGSVWLLFTRECAYGDIGGYPAVMCISTFKAQRTKTNLEIHFFIDQINRTVKKTLTIAIVNGCLPDDIEREILDFADKMRLKGYIPGRVDDENHAVSLVKWWE